ncbi:MAG TPA: DUF6471 domain-containing protein [Rhizomicrobium sp.]|jgi:hypothetical protein|nr:DUF6471 domain-containing protein [Rhizomicrobium sp.]
MDMVTDEAWQAKARNLLKRELAARGVKYPELVEKLAGIGVRETTQNIANKMHRGGFSAVFMLQVLEAIGCAKLVLAES